MDDQDVLENINKLATQEQDLFRKESLGTATDEDRERLGRLNVTLDQCWDLLRQRRALRSAGLDPDDATVRPEQVVEKYTG